MLARPAVISVAETVCLVLTTVLPSPSIIVTLKVSPVFATTLPLLKNRTLYSPGVIDPRVVCNSSWRDVLRTTTLRPVAAILPSGCLTTPVTAKNGVLCEINGKVPIQKRPKLQNESQI